MESVRKPSSPLIAFRRVLSMGENQEEEDGNNDQGILVEKPDESYQYWISRELYVENIKKWCRYVIIEGKAFCLERGGNGPSGDGFVMYEYNSNVNCANLGITGYGSNAPESCKNDSGCVEVEWDDTEVRVKEEGGYSHSIGSIVLSPCTITMMENDREYRGPLGFDLEPSGHGIVTITDSGSKERVNVE